MERQTGAEATEPHVRWMMIDASVQGARDYELAIMSVAPVAELPRALALANTVQHLRREAEEHAADMDEAEFEKKLTAEANILEELRVMLKVFRCAPVTLGSGRSKVPDKLAAFTHSLFLDWGSISGVAKCMAEIISSTTDMGTELHLTRAAGCNGWNESMA